MLQYTSGSYRFGPYEIDLSGHGLFRDGVKVAIQEQPFQILLALLESPGQVVSREELRRRLWGEETFVDFNQSMNSAIRRLRTALEDDPKKPLYVETIPRVGFRFLAQVDFCAPAPVLPADAAAPTAVAPSFWRTRMSAVAAAGSKFQSGLKAGVLSLAILLGISLASPVRRSLRPEGVAAHAAATSNLAAGNPYSDSAGPLLLADAPVFPGEPAVYSNPAAPDILEGHYLLSQRNVASYERARDTFEHALQLDGQSAPALVGLAQVHVLLSMEGRDNGDHAAAAVDFAQRALQIDPNMASAHAALGAAYVVKEWNWSAGSEELQTAIALDPRDSLAHLWYAMFVLVPEKRYHEAEQQARQAIALDPLSLIAQTDLGWIYSNEGETSAALDQLHLVLRMNPNFVPARFRIAQLLHHEGRHQEAAPFEPSDAALVARLRRASVARRASQVAEIPDPCGAASKALSRHVNDPIPVLREAVQRHCANFLYLEQEPGLATVRQDPHFAELANLLKLPEQ